MSRQRSTLIIQLRLPQPPGYKQATCLAWLKEVLVREGSPWKSFETQVKIVGRETEYL